VPFFSSRRTPEPELMDEKSEVDAYASATSARYLAALDLSFVDHVAALMGPDGNGGDGSLRGRALDIGCGPGQIPILMARRWRALDFVAIDAGPTMIEKARMNASAAGVDIDFHVFRLGPEGESKLPYAQASFDLVTCNSVLHHLADPVAALNEMARVLTPEGALLLRDLVRPRAFLHRIHVLIFGRHYHGAMRRLYEASVAAAYTASELRAMLAASRLNDGRSRVFERGRTHIGIERPRRARGS
jgi:2-polyprenyl-3-methyl-5-hydroxy-6-metoxy-1,4-benzoquinol methylase